MGIENNLQILEQGAYPIKLQTFIDPRGNLAIVESGKTIPFEIKRIYYISHVPEHTTRGGHAHLKNEQVLICICGSVDILLDYKKEKKTQTLKEGDALYIGPMIWHEMTHFSSNAVLLVLASEHYEEQDYIRTYENFIQRL